MEACSSDTTRPAPCSVRAAPRESENAAQLCSHLCSVGLEEGRFSDVLLHAHGREFAVHKLVLARSPYFRSLLERWTEGSSVALQLQVEGSSAEGVEAALSWLYGRPAALTAEGVCETLCAAAFLQLDALASDCASFVTDALSEANFMRFHAFAEGANLGPAGDRVRHACWGLLCQRAWCELRPLLRELPLPNLVALFGSAELWCPTEAARFDLACDCFARRAGGEERWAAREHPEEAAALRGVFGRGILYATMSFAALTSARARLTAAGAPPALLAAVADGLWQQTVLRQRVLAAGRAQEGPEESLASEGEGDAAPPVSFRFGVEFAEDPAQLLDGQARHGTEVFFAGSLWKVSAQAFTAGAETATEAALAGSTSRLSLRSSQPQQRTLGLFLHRRRADAPLACEYEDVRECINARYMLMLAGQRQELGVLVLGTVQSETAVLLPKAPKGWGWRTVAAMDAVQQPLRVGVVVQLADA